MPELISRAEARERGLKRYFTGELCKLGHIAERYTDNSTCLQCHRLRSEIYRRKHPEECKQRIKKHRIKNWKRVRAYTIEYNKKWVKTCGLESRRKIKETKDRYKLNGPQNPKGELQWLRKAKAQLRSLKRKRKLRPEASP